MWVKIELEAHNHESNWIKNGSIIDKLMKMQTKMETVELKQTKGGKLNYSAGGLGAAAREIKM